MLKTIFSFVFLLTLSWGIAAQTTGDFVIGEFAVTKITDADTFRFDKLDRPARLLAIDTEETFKTPDAREKTDEIAQNWEEFYRLQKGESKFPVKTDSPLGYEAWMWAIEFMKDVESVRLEKEADDRDKDIFDRYLVYMIAKKKDGSEVNYNIECVRMGYSPYFNKYGNSKRFHAEFVDAQNYAKENKLGIWDPEKKKYPDYEERLVWWDKRAQQLEYFEQNYSGKEGYINLSSLTDYDKLKDLVGTEITVFGGIGNVMTDKQPFILRIPIRKDVNFDLVIKDNNTDLLNSLDLDNKKEYYIYAKGILDTYKDRYQIILNDKSQIWMEP